MFAVTALLTACDPVVDNSELVPMNYSAEQVGNAVNFEVYKDEACTEKAGPAEGNWVKYYTTPSTPVTIVNYTASGAENILAIGPAGVFKLSPKRGSSPDQEVAVRVVNSDNSVVEAKKTVSVWVKSDLEPELKLLLGEAGKKNWIWDYNAPTGSTCWGNGGHAGNGAAFTARTVDGHWWGVDTPEGLLDQLQHSDTQAPSGEESTGAYMTFDEDGNIVSYDANGQRIRKSSFTLTGYDPTRESTGWQIATLKTAEPAVLFPFSINEGGKTVTEFDVMYLDANHMTLVYTKDTGSGSWGEITHWMFKNASPSTDILEGSSERKWGWANDGVECWGNAGNSGNGAGYNVNTVDGKWWGVMTGSELQGQLAHSGGTDFGDAADDAYMIFGEGKVTSYKADGSAIRSGKYALDIYPEGRANNWEIGKLTTNAVLFPFSINEGGKQVEEFDVMYMDGDNMTLVYTKGNGAGSWGEITYWRFAAK